MRVFSLGDSALTIEFGNELTDELNAKALNLASHFELHPFPGFVEAVPAYSSVSIFYDSAEVRKSLDTSSPAFASVSELAVVAAQNISGEFRDESRVIEIPFNCDESDAPDLDRVNDFSGIGRDEVLKIFVSGTYRVYMLGFLPGFAYMGEVDERIAAPRLDSPRTKVPKGSVGIAGKQTGIYPMESPGGWNIIGRTTMKMFDPEASDPCPLKPGDLVRFVIA